MINLRYHIVSITAVFLALAIGILMGTSLLNRATVESLRGAQKRLEARIRERSQEIAAFRDAVEDGDEAARQFDDRIRPTLTAGLISDPVLLVAVRGIDESVVEATRAALGDAGAGNLGTLWIEPAAVLEDAGVRDQVVTVLGATSGAEPAAARKLLIDALVAGLRQSPPREGPSGAETTTTLAPTEPPTDAVNTLIALTTTGALSWEVDEGSTPSLPPGARTVILSGEGVAEPLVRVVAPLVRALGRVSPSSLVVGEVMAPRSISVEIERRLGDQLPTRGDFVDTFRSDRTLNQALVTIDDLDRPAGRLSLVLVLSQDPGSVTGAYGVASSATEQFPVLPPR